MNEQNPKRVDVPLKQAISVNQSGSSLLISGILAGGARPIALWARRPHSGWVKLGKAIRKRRWFKRVPRNAFSWSVDLAARSGGLSSLLTEYSKDRAEPNVALFMEVECPKELLSTERGTASATDLETVRSTMRLGQFNLTDIGPLVPVSVAGNTRLPYVNKQGNLVIAINRQLQKVNQIDLQEVRLSDGFLYLNGSMQTRHRDIQIAYLVLVAAQQEERLYKISIRSTEDTEKTRQHYGLRHYSFSAAVDLKLLFEHSWSEDDVLAGWLETVAEGEQEPHRQRLPEASRPARVYDMQSSVTLGATSLVVSHHSTPKSRSASFRVEAFGADVYTSLRRRLERSAPNPSVTRKVWLVGEKPTRAQDTGLHFFRYLRRTHPEIAAFYVIDFSSSEAKNLRDLSNVIPFRSHEHVDLFFEAECFIGSHHPDYLYPSRAPLVRQAASGSKIFLQHGVMGTKWMVPMYGKQGSSFETDLVITSSDREKQYVVHDFGYHPDQVAVTGLSRYDSLFANDVEVRRHQILIIPTWRDWLGSTEKFLRSIYFQSWQEFLVSPGLKTLSLEYGLDILFCLHPNMQKYSKYFVAENCRIVSQEAIDVQFLLKQSAIMITDFSSVAFDFSFLHKPVIYYQFDRKRFIGSWGSHINLDNELPGPICSHPDKVIEELRSHLRESGEMRQEFIRRADRFLLHRDQGNNERIVERVQASITPNETS